MHFMGVYWTCKDNKDGSSTVEEAYAEMMPWHIVYR